MRADIFIGSSSEALAYAECMRDIIKVDRRLHLKAVTWKDYFRKHGSRKVTIDALKDVVESMRIALFFITGDDVLVIRKKKGHAARTNVWIEIGMFVARYSRLNAIVLVNEDDLSNQHIPSDYYGVNLLPYSLARTHVKAIHQSWKNGRRAPKASLEALKAAMSSCFRDTVRLAITDLVNAPTDFIEQIPTRKQCYAKGREMIMSAQEFVYTIIAYENELDDKHDFPEGCTSI